MKQREIFYFAHPYTCKNEKGEYIPGGEEANFRICNYRASKLIEKGYLIYSPISHSHPIHVANSCFLKNDMYTMWMQCCIDMISIIPFKGIILAPGWEGSSGCQEEYEIFYEAGKDILYYSDIVVE